MVPLADAGLALSLAGMKAAISSGISLGVSLAAVIVAIVALVSVWVSYSGSAAKVEVWLDKANFNGNKFSLSNKRSCSDDPCTKYRDAGKSAMGCLIAGIIVGGLSLVLGVVAMLPPHVRVLPGGPPRAALLQAILAGAAVIPYILGFILYRTGIKDSDLDFGSFKAKMTVMLYLPIICAILSLIAAAVAALGAKGGAGAVADEASPAKPKKNQRAVAPAADEEKPAEPAKDAPAAKEPAAGRGAAAGRRGPAARNAAAAKADEDPAPAPAANEASGMTRQPSNTRAPARTASTRTKATAVRR